MPSVTVKSPDSRTEHSLPASGEQRSALSCAYSPLAAVSFRIRVLVFEGGPLLSRQRPAISCVHCRPSPRCRLYETVKATNLKKAAADCSSCCHSASTCCAKHTCRSAYRLVNLASLSQGDPKRCSTSNSSSKSYASR